VTGRDRRVVQSWPQPASIDDESLVRECPQRQFRTPGGFDEWIAHRHRHNHRFSQQRVELQSCSVGRRAAVKRDIDLIFPQALEQIATEAFLDRECHPGKGVPERTDYTRYKGMKRSGGRRSDADLTLFALRGALRGLNGALDSRKDVARCLQQRTSGIGQFNAARLAAKQLHPKLSFERLDLPAERRLLHLKPFGSARDVTFFSRHRKIPQASEFHVIPNWYRYRSNDIISDLVRRCYAGVVREVPPQAEIIIGAHMKMPRRQFLKLVAGAFAVPASARIASAQTYPARAVHVIVGYAAGGASDIAARLIGQRLSERLGQPFIIENRPGAASNLATETVVNAPPDGHTLLLVSASNAINATLYDKLNYNFIRDIAPVGSITRGPLVMLVNPSFPAKTVTEFIAHAKAKPDQVNMASAGVGSPQHLAGELFKAMTGIKMLHVPYRGAPPALTDLISGQVQVYFGSMAGAIAYVRAGQLRAIAVTSATRSDALPDIPTIGETMPGYEATTWYGIGAPKGTLPALINRLNAEINAALGDLGIKAHMAELGETAFSGSPADFARLIADETERWGKAVKLSGAKGS
jgi:tripartite-type tricarboxylate transporter receptor subunit TctC